MSTVWVKYKPSKQQIKNKYLHKKLHRDFGNATKCENINCTCKYPKRYEWALKKGHQYSSDAKDYIQLCPSCHRKYDFTEAQREKCRLSHLGECQSKLKESEVLEIISLIKDGISNKEIAAKYNVHPTTICDIKRGKRWSFLTNINFIK